MKKVIIASAVLFFAAANSASASTLKAETFSVQQDTTSKSKTPVKPEELPKAVKDVLAGDEYKGWTVSSASWIKGTSEYYEIALTKATESKVAKLDKEGKKVD